MVRRYALIGAHLLCLAFLPAAVSAQNAAPILPTGDAAVAGFSGTFVLGPPPPPEPKRVDKTYINLDGPSLRVIGLGRMGGPPQAQLVAAPKSFTATARQIGQVFSLALDDANPPNIYAAASSAYGLPIVVPDGDGDGVPDRARRGAPNAAFMPGLFGPVQSDGGPGSIWKINGSTGAVTLFANVTLGGVPNSGPALGGLAFDPASHQLFVADRDTGLIHRFTLDGIERGRFDHGTQALSAAGLPPIGFDPRKRLNIEDPAFDSANPATWAYAPPARRVFGMAVNRGRLYYAVAAGLRIWSVSLMPDGSFGPDSRFEVSVPRTASQSAEISEILFDDNGDMLVAERGAPTGAYDYKALAESPENRVLRFRPKSPDDPPSRDLWFPVPKEYAIGFPPTLRNDNGGIAIGYGYDSAGNINRAVCGGTLWSTGERLRNAADRATIRRLQSGGPLLVDGLQGNSTRLLRPLNEPPFETYFIDYDDRFDDPQTRGYLGDVVIWRVCGQAALPLVPVVLICPLGLFNVDGVCRFPLTCPAGTEFSDGCCGYRGCPASYVRVNGKCVPPQRNCNPRELLSAEGRCESPKCPAGMVFVSNDAAGGSGPGGLTAPNSGALSPGARNALEEALKKGGGRDKPKSCSGGGYCKCPEGTQRSEDGTCKKSSGCGPHMTLRDGECVCENGYGYSTDLKTCVPISVCDPGTPGGNTSGCCKPGRQWSQASLSCDPPPRCDASDPTSMVTQGGQCVCKDGSSASGGRFNGSNVASGTALDGVFQSGSGQNCCPSDRKYDPVTNKCGPPPDNKNPKLSITKTGSICTYMPDNRYAGGRAITCQFTVKVKNEGDAPASEVAVTETPTPPAVVNNWFYSPASLWTCTPAPGAPPSQVCRLNQPLAPGGEVELGVITRIDPNAPGPAYGENCAALTGGTNLPAQDGIAIGNPTLPLPGKSLPTVSRACKTLPFPPNVTITKILNNCCMSSAGGAYSEMCEFSVSVKNNGTTTYTGPLTMADEDPNSDPSDPGLGSFGSTSTITIGPGETQTFALPPRHYKPGTRFKNCVSMPGQSPNTSSPSGPGISCVTQDVPAGVGQCLAATPPRPPPPPPPPPTITVTCPRGTVLMNNQCFFVDPGCTGPECRPVVVGCPGGGQRNLDGICPTPTTTDPGCQGPNCNQVNTGCAFNAPRKADGACCNSRDYLTGACAPPACTGGKTFNDGACRCNYGMKDNGSGTCVRTGGESKKTTSKKTRRPTTNSDNPVPAGPQFNIQIGPGFPGGGRPGGGGPTKGGGGCGPRCG